MKFSVACALAAVCLLSPFASGLQAQTTIRVMSYNLLNFPSPNPPGRVDTLAKILSYYQPNLFIVQELRSESGLFQINQKINSLGYGSFSYAPYMPLMSDPFASQAQVQALIYDRDLFSLKSQFPILTELRDINEYVLYLNTPALAAGDTTFLYVYACHLKAATGSANETSRLNMVNEWKEHVADRVPADACVIFAGDFNVYRNTEPAYVALTDLESPLPLFDVYESLGNWSNSAFPHRWIYTQSTRVNQLFGDGAGGGLDDRFDFILFSNPMLDPDNYLHFVEGSYLSLGNNGTCYDQDILDCADDNDVPFSILRAIYFMSDHIPQVCELGFNGEVAVAEPESSDTGVFLTGSADSHSGYCVAARNGGKYRFTLSDPAGRRIRSWEKAYGAGTHCEEFPADSYTGVALFQVTSASSEQSVHRIVLQER
jgi:hypothetical protein